MTRPPEDEDEELQQRALQERLGLLDAQRPRRLAVLQGLSLHADTAVHGHDRQGLERLCRYGARGPVAESRLRRLEDGRYQYAPKKGGGTATGDGEVGAARGLRRGWPAVSTLVPRQVKQEAERYLGCGDVRCGSVEVRCADCRDSRLAAHHRASTPPASSPRRAIEPPRFPQAVRGAPHALKPVT